MLSDDEAIRLIRIAVERLGIREIRFTGGEPLLRKDLERIIGAITQLRTEEGSAPETSLTTNALGLDRRARPLAEAGLRRVNISLDALDRATYTAITRRDRFDDTLTGIKAAADAGMAPIKLNSVLMRDQNEEQAPDLLAFALEHGYELRFIEQMPLGPDEAWGRERMVSADEILSKLQKRYNLRKDNLVTRGSAPAELWQVLDGRGTLLGTVGIIAAVTDDFCGACDRTRLTADGQVRNCLFARSEHDLRGPLRTGATDEELAQTWRAAQWEKLAGHGIDNPGFLQPDRLMSAIGG